MTETLNTQPEGGGLRYDAGKPRWDLLPLDAIKEVVDVYTAGAKKYAARNWEKGMNWSTVHRALMSHLYKFWQLKERNDDELATHHMAMVAWNALALLTYDIRKIGNDDRP